MRPRRRTVAPPLVVLAGALVSGSSDAAELPHGGRAWLVGPECRVRSEGPIDCDPVTAVSAVVGEHVQVQLILEGGSQPTPIRIRDVVHPGPMLFVPVTRRSRGASGDDALPWAASARPDDATVLGRVADPYRWYAPASASFELAPGERRVFWCSFATSWRTPSPVVFFEDDADGPRLELELIDTPLPRPVVSFFAYVERDELARRELDHPARPPGSLTELQAVVQNAGVLAVDRVVRPEDLALQRQAPVPTWPERDLVVLGAYGALGEPTDEAVDQVRQLAGITPAWVRDVVLYAVDEACDSDLGPRWRARLQEAGGIASRVKVLVTCSEDPARLDVDVVMMTAERFDPDRVARARAAGKEVWVYNGRLPQAGPMALDAPPESLLWNGWIAARYDVRRWFLWNVNHWSDGNRGGHGPRDLYADPETFHNADGDAVLYDGLLVFPATAATRALDPDTHHAVLASARLARLHRGIEDAGLLALAAMVDPRAAADALALVVPRALGEVGDEERTPLGDARTVVRARAMLHRLIARGAAEGILPRAPGHAPGRPAPTTPPPVTDKPHPGLLRLRAAIHSRQLAEQAAHLHAPAIDGRIRTLASGGAVAACLVVVAIGASRLARRRRAH